ncbi:unnamed protein product [Rhizoctonia solani]|uniref:ATP-dependent DNA helicase n=1 Tax=Rhizoctonia solani TaxID=456999 RepID=A0A8H3D6X2_9AGAM|nr:unnamed protein product [Rhizoctonia solani]
MSVGLFGHFRSINRFALRFSDCLGGQASRIGVKSYFREYHESVRAVSSSRHSTQRSGALQYAVKSNLIQNGRRSTNNTGSSNFGHFRNEPIVGPTRDRPAVQRSQPHEDVLIEPSSSNRIVSLHHPQLPRIFRPELSNEQRHILQKVLQGEILQGTGKSVLLRAIIEALGGPSDEVAVTASTGISAVHIGGQTLHSFAGVGLGHGDINKSVGRITQDDVATRRWRAVKVLIIDEVSMVDATWFDQLEEIARRIRRKKRPFGGIQLVICGDFFQLPPVPNRDLIDAPASFVFDSWTWDQPKLVVTPYLFSTPTNTGPELVKMLDDARLGIVTNASAALLKSLARPVHYEDGIGPTQIYPRRFEADYANRRQLMTLSGPRRVYSAHDSYGKDDDGNKIDPERAVKLFGGMIVPKSLPLKVGAQVMCLRNIRPKGLVNGSIGRVIDFMTPGQARTYAETNPQWSIITSIKSPISPKGGEASAGDTPIPGRATKTLWSYELFEQAEWPLVQFMDGQCVLMGPTNFTVETRQGTMEVQRLQVPLVLAWALTVWPAITSTFCH